jgi:hypothetical protein
LGRYGGEEEIVGWGRKKRNRKQGGKEERDQERKEETDLA